jgi:copper chaperone CopZ
MKKNNPIRNFQYLASSIMLSLFFLMSFSTYATGEKKGVVEIKIKTSAVCDMCKERIEKGLIFEKGIKDITLDIETKIATVKYKADKTNPETIKSLISKLGYDADEILADKEAYEKLPACCKKDAAPH